MKDGNGEIKELSEGKWKRLYGECDNSFFMEYISAMPTIFHPDLHFIVIYCLFV